MMMTASIQETWARFQSAVCSHSSHWLSQVTGSERVAPIWTHEVLQRLDPIVCSKDQLLPILLLAAFAAAVAALVVLLFAMARRLMRWYTAKRGSTFVNVATVAAAELRSHDAVHYPPTAHVWFTHRGGGSPVVCRICYMPVILEGQTQCCECCGIVVHHHCVRKVPADCRPLVLPPTEHQLHDWRPAGVAVSFLQQALSATNSNGGVPDTAMCLYCAEPCEVGLFAVEPVWLCSCCHVSAHVQCYANRHPDQFTDATRAALESQSLAAAGTGAPMQPTTTTSPGGTVRDNNLLQPSRPGRDAGGGGMAAATQRRSGGGGPRLTASPPGGAAHNHVASEPNATGRSASPWTRDGSKAVAAAGAATAGNARGPIVTTMNSSSSALTGGGGGHRRAHSYPDIQAGEMPDVADVPEQQRRRLQQRQQQQEARGVTDGMTLADQLYTGGLMRHVAGDQAEGGDGQGAATAGGQGRLALDICTYGRHRQAVLPATCVQVMFDAPLLTAAQAAVVFGVSQPDGQIMSASPSANNLALQGSSGGGASGSAMVAASTKGGGKRKSSGKKSNKASWWQRREPVRFRDYRISWLPLGCRPVLVYVNIKSGPQIGLVIKRQLLQLLHPLQVVELPREKPELALRCFAWLPGLRILVIGGDGTAGWVLQCIDALSMELNDGVPADAVTAGAKPQGGGGPGSPVNSKLWRPPPVAVLPLGTGNDLARCLAWGSGSGEVMRRGIQTVLDDVVHAAPTLVDRWNVHIMPVVKSRGHGFRNRHAPASVTSPDGGTPPSTPHAAALTKPPALGEGGPSFDCDKGKDGGTAAVVAAAPAVPDLARTASGKGEVKILSNYLGIGIDAKVALEVHHIRENYPTWFQSQVGNKMWYAGVGATDLLGHSCSAIHKRLQIICDNVDIIIPPDAEGVLILNIASFMGGVDAWAQGVPGPPQAFSPDSVAPRRQSMHDGLMEIVAVYGALHLGQLQVGMSQVTRLCQGSNIVINTFEALPMQVDGEPWMQPPATVHLALKGQATMLRRLDSCKTARFSQIVWDVLEQSEHRGVITASQRQVLAAELAARVVE